MGLIIKNKIQHAVYWIEIPQIKLKILCGCPENSSKHLRKKGLVHPAEKAGVFYEEGPNAILLSDIQIQKKSLSNLAEFPILQMFYRQGLLLPEHPNNGDINPMILGTEQQIKAQLEYVYCGNYGITEESQYLDEGVSAEQSKKILRAKLFFAYGRFIPSSELIEQVVIDDKKRLIRDGAYVKRIEPNVFEISFKHETARIDLNLRRNQKYKSTYKLPKCQLPVSKFAVVHTGEGDGWDYTRPCIGSMIIQDKRRFLVDAGPNITQTLSAFGLKAKDIDGVYFTHVHDDHFAGLFSLIQEKRKLTIFSTRPVYLSIIKKISTLIDKDYTSIKKMIRFDELKEDSWNDNQGLEVKPIDSPHPVDTTLLIFRMKKGNSYKSYGHYSDITALSVLESMVSNEPNTAGITETRFKELKKLYKTPYNLKKVDVGGPTIHGNPRDFKGDTSDKLVLSHTTEPLDNFQLKIGSQAEFGEADILID